jgi:tripartite motif-containing protein 71
MRTTGYFILVILLFCISIANANTVNYDKGEALAYARDYCSDYNSNYQKYPGFDCANFVSQALIKGGLNFDNYPNHNEIGEGTNKGKGGFYGVAKLRDALVMGYCFGKITDPSQAQPGDILFTKDKTHVMIYAGKEYSPKHGRIVPVYYGHSRPVCADTNYKDPDNIWSDVDVYRFWGNDDKCKKCKQVGEFGEFGAWANKCSEAENCISETGECDPKCKNIGGRCTPRVSYDFQLGKCITSYGGECPDDTLTVGTGIITQPAPPISSTATVGVLGAGFTYDVVNLLRSFKEEARIVQMGDISSALIKDMPLLVVPSAGLYGTEKSEFFKAALNDYIEQGGTILVLSQQHGYQYAAIPGGLSGYGWLEDQSCYINSSYIDTWHPVLAGQTRSTPSINIDGYFTQYPENTTVLLRRTSNGQPALLLYPYGSGYVIATSAFTDTAYTVGEASEDERRLVRDMVTWAKSAASLVEVKQGEIANLALTIINNDTIESATACEIELYDPDRIEVKLRTKIPVNLPPGQSTQIPLMYTTPLTAPLGVYQTKYGLLTEGFQLLTSEENPEGLNFWLESLLQPPIEDASGRFVVSNPPKTYVQTKQITFSIQSDTNDYLAGSAVNSTILVFNLSDEERTITAKFEGRSQVMVVPANGSSSFEYSKIAQCDHEHYGQLWGMLTASFYENDKLIGGAMQWYRVYPPIAGVTVGADKTQYAKGETVIISASLKNGAPFSWQGNAKIVIFDYNPANYSYKSIFEETKTVNLSASGIVSVSFDYTIPGDLPVGTYPIAIQTLGNGTNIGRNAWTYFILPQSQVSVEPGLPSVYNVGTNTIHFTISNTGMVNVNSGALNLSLKTPDGSIVYSGSQPFSLAVGQSETLDIPISIPSLKLGYYTLTYSQSDETRTGYPTSIILPNSYNLDLSLDKPSYKIGETANVTVSLTNAGKFVQEGSLALDVPFLGLSETRSVTINPSVTESIPFSFPLPLTLKQGGSVQLTFTFPSGDRIERGIYLAIKPAGINQNIVFDKASYRIRENLGINYTITNDGNFATPLNVSFNLSIPDLNYIYEGSLVLEPMIDVAVPLVIPLPETLLPGWHNVNVTLALPWEPSFTRETGFVVPESSLLLSYLGTTTPMAGDTISLSIENTGGVDTTYTTQTLSINDSHGVEIYHGSVTGAILTGEKKNLVDIQIPVQVLNGPAYLHVQMRDSKTAKTVYYDRAIEITGLAASLQTMTDKNTYLFTEAITGISSILNGPYGIEQGSMKVSVNRISQATTGQFTQFLPKGKGVIFSYPGGVAVGPDGSVYVTDSENHRIQKFDSNGNIIRKWGSYCNIDSDGDGIVDQSCDGQFNYPYSIAVGSDGSVYVADSENHRIQKFDSNGTFITKWGSYCQADTNWDGIPDQSCNDGQFNYPGAVAVGADGSVYVADGNHRIQKFDSNGTFITKWGSYCNIDSDWDGIPDQPCEGQFYYPSGIAIGIDGSVYVVESGNARIQKFDSNGTFITKWGSYCNIDSDWDGIPDQLCEGGQFADPYGIAISPDGSLYVADSQNNRIQKFDSSGNFLMKWGSGGAGNDNGEFNTPFGVTIGNDGSIYITDSGNSRIQKFDSNGDFITKWGSVGNGDGQFDWPAGIASGADGSVYVADSYNNRIQKFDSNGNFVSKWLVFGIEQSFDGPLGIAVGPDGSVYVADTNNYRIEKFDSDGNLITQWEISWGMCGEVNCPPTGIAVGPDGAVYVVDPYNHRIHKFDSNGSSITSWELYGALCDEFCPPAGIAVGPDGSVYAADTNSSLIRKFDGNGNLITAWGSSGSDDGQFYNPGGIVVAPDGSIYVADMGNHRIQKMITVTTEYIAETLFETTIPINQPASATQDYTTDIGTLSVTGKLLLQAILKNSLGQTMGQASYPFYIVDGNTVLLFNTDKKIYKLGETVTITGQVENRATIEAAGLTLTLNSQLRTQNSELLYTETFNIPAGGTQLFTITTTAGAEGIVTLTGNVTQSNSTLVEITDQYEVAKSNVSAAVSMPDVIGSAPFDINVEIRNTGKVEATVQFGVQSSEFGDSQTITIPPGEIKIIQYSQQISIDTTYTFTFTGDLEQTLQQMVRFGESAEVQLTLQPSYKEGDILLTYQLRNTGMLEAAYPVTFTLFSNGQEISKIVRTFTLPVNGSVSDSINYNLGEGSYILRYETRGFQIESQINVAKAAQGEITMAVNDFYSEGSIIFPYTVKNIGAFDAEFAFEFELGATLISNTAFISAGGEYSGDLRFNLPFGNYTIKATLVSQPANPFSRSFQVLRENIAEMVVALGTQTDGLIPVNVNLTNLGFNEISGSVNVSVTAGSGQAVWNGEETLSQLSPQSSQLINFIVNPSAIEPGNYTLQAQLLNNSNQLIVARSLEFGVQSANFQITQLPPYQTFMAGQEATFVFRVRNIGDQESSFDLRFKAYDLIDSTKREWLKPGEEKTIPFGFILPEDLEEKDYFATYELNAQSLKVNGQVKYHLAGINLNVNAILDKPYYTEGETAHLTINIQTSNPNPQNLFARMNYAGYESQQTFTLNGSQVLIFDVPLPQITGEKLFYGIYHEEGRSIHLNSLYIHKAGDVITIITDKQVYNAGETVSVSVTGSATGDMTLSAPGGYTETFTFIGSATKSFPLPATIAAGTYFISYQLSTTSGESYTETYPFDVAGIQVKVVECNNDKGKYASSDTIATSFMISSNTTMPAVLKAWIVDPTGQYTNVGEQSITLSSSENSLVTYNSALGTSVSGIHRLVYGVYSPEDLLLCSGSEAFDVGDAVLMGLSTDKKDYPTNTEPVIIAASLFGSVNAELQLELDGTVIKSETISLNGFTPYTTEVQNITPGPHILKASLIAGGLKSTKETNFTYALAYIPKPQIFAFPVYVDFGIINPGSTFTQTITLSSTGNVDLVIGMIALSGTDQGEFSIQNDNCSGGTFIPSGTCTLDVLFSPTSIGAKSASLSILSNASDTPTLILSLGGAAATTLNVSINPESSGRVTGTGIDCPGDCTESFSTSGATIQFTAVPTEGYQFTNWTGDINSPENPLTVNMDTNKNITANFVISTFTIAATAGLGGTITPLGPVAVNYGGNQTFFITPSLGYYIMNVMVDGVSIGPVATYTFSNVTSNHTIEVIFAITQYSITATAGLNGAITPAGSVIVNYGASQTFNITPNVSYHVADVKVDGVSLGAMTTFTFDNVTSNHTIEANFDVDTTATWAKTYGGQGYDVALSARQTGDGGYIVAGESWSFHPLFSDAWVIKLDANGSIQWQKRYGGRLNDVIYSIEQTQDGGYIMAGETNAVLPFLGLFWVVKLDANGEGQWQKTYSQGWAHSIQQTSEGGYVATGMNMGKSWIVKLDANGDIQWQKKYAGILEDLAQSVQQTSEGGYIVAGMMKGEVWGLKLNSAGETQWQKTYGNSCVDANFSIQQTQEGGYIMASVSLTFGAGYTDIWIVKLDPNGAIEWQKTYGGSGFDLAHSIEQTQDGGYVVAGWTGSFGAGDKDAWVLKLDANGNMSGCPEELIGTTSIVPYNTSATVSQCNETGQTTYVYPKSGSATVNGTTVTSGSVCGD